MQVIANINNPASLLGNEWICFRMALINKAEKLSGMKSNNSIKSRHVTVKKCPSFALTAIQGKLEHSNKSIQNT